MTGPRSFTFDESASLEKLRDWLRENADQPELEVLLAVKDLRLNGTAAYEDGVAILLRGRQVTVYGRPFYAGWGLTADRMAMDRGRRLTLEELVAGALILYPRYLDPVTRQPCGPELIVDRLETPELWRTGPLVRLRRLQGVMARGWRELISACLLRFAR